MSEKGKKMTMREMLDSGVDLYSSRPPGTEGAPIFRITRGHLGYLATVVDPGDRTCFKEGAASRVKSYDTGWPIQEAMAS